VKKKTKELIKWAMGLIDDYRVQNMVEHSNFRKNTPAAQNSEIEIKNCKDFAEFLNSLPEMESHLCRGGFIQDKNGTPCGDGDKIITRTLYGILYWSKNDFRFYLKANDTLYTIESNFEKVPE
jgi:hypothetical protein